MILDEKNYIDQLISNYFSKETIDRIEPDKLDYFGININSKQNEEFLFKVYYDNQYSKEQYKQHYDVPVINFLYEKNMVGFLEIVHDKDNNECTRFNIGLTHCNNDNMMQLFSWLEKNVTFWQKYKDEILTMSTIKCSTLNKYDYSSLFFIGFVYDKREIKTLKCYWLNKNRKNHPTFNDEYYIDFIKKNGPQKLKELLPIANKALVNCGRHLCMEGIDYNEKYSEKHKIYIDYPTNLYEGLLETFSEYYTLKNNIKHIKEWNKIHQEFYCDGYAIGKDIDNNITLNIYFKLKKEKSQ